MRNMFTTVHRERGQILMLTALMITAFLGLVGLVVDAGFHYVERRQVQNAADEATLAAVYEMRYGGSSGDIIAAALENAAANGYDNDGVGSTVTVNMPPSSGDYVGNSNAVEVVIRDLDVPTFFIQVLVPSATQIQARGVARLSAGTAILTGMACDADPEVDGRVLEETEGYTKIADLVSTTTSVDYGDAFYACDDQFLYFALRMNGPSTGGPVANENVYGGDGCGDDEIEYKNGEIDKVTGAVLSIGVNTFTVRADGTDVTVDVDGATTYKGDLNDFGDITVGMSVEVKVKTDYGGFYILAKEVKDTNDVFCPPGTIDPDYHQTYNTGWDTGSVSKHTFGKLLGSDRSRFQITCDGQVRHDFIQDYLRQAGNNWISDAAGDGTVYVAAPTDSASSLEFNLENPDITGWAYAELQSPPFNPQYPTYDSAYDGFVWEMIYEFKVPRQPLENCNQVTFSLRDSAGSTGGLEGMHSSPAKTEDGVFLEVATDVRLVE